MFRIKKFDGGISRDEDEDEDAEDADGGISSRERERERESGDFFFYSERWSKVKQVLNAKSKIAAAGVGAAAASSLQIRNIWPKRSRKRFHNKKVKFHDETDVQKMF